MVLKFRWIYEKESLCISIMRVFLLQVHRIAAQHIYYLYFLNLHAFCVLSKSPSSIAADMQKITMRKLKEEYNSPRQFHLEHGLAKIINILQCISCYINSPFFNLVPNGYLTVK